MYFSREYMPERALVERDEDNGEVVSSLLLQPYRMTFHGNMVGASYVSGAATRRRYRGHGYMGQLMKKVLKVSAGRGDMLCMLVPADSRLYLYYARLGFSPVFYTRLMRYTSLHVFQCEGFYQDVASDELNRLYAAFSRMMEARECCVQHSRSQFETIMADCRLSGGVFAAVADSSGEVCAMTWGMPEADNDVVRVTELLSTSDDAAAAALAGLQKQIRGKALTVMGLAPDDNSHWLTVRGMARLTRVDQAMAIVARACPALKCTVRVSDPVIDSNHAIYIIDRGDVNVLPYDTADIKCDLDVSVSVLADMLFSSSAIGEITGLPAVRPHLSLMLE